MSSSIVAGILAAAGSDVPEMTEIELPVPPVFYGLLAMALFLVLLAITYSFKNISARR
ncbi:hypothetical protein [Aquipuribacter hungaricus]|uniref:Uncharacterized protein n=1 Tax=Aquipuribacter hungaricus TaxID=545624 RepID=A0ABV7WDH4_9MICO